LPVRVVRAVFRRKKTFGTGGLRVDFFARHGVNF